MAPGPPQEINSSLLRREFFAQGADWSFGKIPIHLVKKGSDTFDFYSQFFPFLYFSPVVTDDRPIFDQCILDRYRDPRIATEFIQQPFLGKVVLENIPADTIRVSGKNCLARPHHQQAGKILRQPFVRAYLWT